MIHYFVVILAGTCIIFSSCDFNCMNDADIEVSDLLIYHFENRDISYCEILDGALKKDPVLLDSFLNLVVQDGAGYDHASVLIELIEFLGEDYFLEFTKGYTQAEINMIKSYLEVGFELDQRYANQSLENLLPRINNEWFPPY